MPPVSAHLGPKPNTQLNRLLLGNALVEFHSVTASTGCVPSEPLERHVIQVRCKPMGMKKKPRESFSSRRVNSAEASWNTASIRL
jgi:hypothetical protein